MFVSYTMLNVYGRQRKKEIIMKETLYEAYLACRHCGEEWKTSWEAQKHFHGEENGKTWNLREQKKNVFVCSCLQALLKMHVNFYYPCWSSVTAIIPFRLLVVVTEKYVLILCSRQSRKCMSVLLHLFPFLQFFSSYVKLCDDETVNAGKSWGEEHQTIVCCNLFIIVYFLSFVSIQVFLKRDPCKYK